MSTGDRGQAPVAHCLLIGLVKQMKTTTLASAFQAVVLTLCVLLHWSAHAQNAKEPVKLNLRIEASPQTNPDEAGRPSPVKVRVYELKDSNTFTEVDFFGLNANDKSVLGADLLARDEFILKPGEVRKIERKTHPATTAIGVIAGYRDLNSTWRHVHVLPEAPEASWLRVVMPSKKFEATIQLQPQGILLVPAP